LGAVGPDSLHDRLLSARPIVLHLFLFLAVQTTSALAPTRSTSNPFRLAAAFGKVRARWVVLDDIEHVFKQCK
jgi:hypothetical protein